MQQATINEQGAQALSLGTVVNLQEKTEPGYGLYLREHEIAF